MIKSKFFFGLTLFTVFSFTGFKTLNAQMVGTNAYVKGASVEFGVSGSGGFEGVDQSISPAPAGYHARSTFLPFGFIANPQVNAWATFDGDFFTPGSPENGWGFEIGVGGAAGSNNYNFVNDIPGSITSVVNNPTCHIVDWEGNATTGTNLHFKIEYLLEQNDLFYTTTVSITNNTAAAIPDLFYYRSFDPDNNEEISSDFTTQNTIVCQPFTVGGSGVACVSATSLVPATQPQSYVGLAGIGSNFRVTYGGFSNRSGSDIWNGTSISPLTGFYSTPLVQTVGSTNFADEGISLAYRVQNLLPGATKTFKFHVILDNAAATGILTVSFPGSSVAQVCDTSLVDTIASCGAPVPLTLTGSTVNNYSWTWSPAAGLSTTSGINVIANPTTTTTYVATGTPTSVCVASSPVTVQFVMIVLGAVAPPVITPVSPVCTGSPPFNIGVTTAGPGTWSGPGITNTSAGTFNPSAPGAYLVSYSYPLPCILTDTMTIFVVGADPTIAPTVPVCAGSASFTMTAASPGGVWSGGGISATGVFNPTTAGTFTVTYTISGVCTAVDTQLVVVNPTVPPITGISYTSPVCISAANPILTTAAGFTTGGVFASTPAGLSLSSTGAVSLASSSAGTYTITYSFAATGCGPAGSSSTTLVITPLAVPVLGFSYPTVCATDTADAAPVPVAGFTIGGTYSSTTGLVINDSTGVVDVNGSTPGTYTVTYSVIGSSVLCTASGNNTATITINPLPIILMSPEQTIWVGQSTWIYASGGTSYLWSPSTDLSCPNCDSSMAAPPVTTTYCVIVNQLGCIDSACLKVNVEIPCPSNRNMGIPNAFSPNGDNVNDKFCLDGWADCITKFEIVIFDRWGEKVFESKDPDFCWDGIFNGKALDPGVFVYFVKATYATAGTLPISPQGSFDVNRTGNISLVR
ncbi:MAG: gliding motility-associated C-terminal domain-containing protein [Bacteroidetes bacterium]|nr:gliding motility-associated C-terminal domain-containing protein [Bacteroidota bacterium]